MEQTRSRITWKDIAVAMLVLALLAALVWLFLRPVEPARQIVFGDLGRHATSSNTVVHGPVEAAPPTAGTLVSNDRPRTANIPMTNEPGRDLNDQSPRLMEPTPAGQGRGLSGAGTNSSRTALSSNSAPQMGGSPSSNQMPIAPSVAVPIPVSPPPPANYSSARETNSPWTPGAEAPPDPANKDTTAKLLAEAKAANMARVNHTPSRTADLLGNDAPSQLFDPEAGSNVVFMLDNSMDMTNSGRSSAARQEVVRALQSMSASQFFYVLFFHAGGYEGMPALAPLPASPENVRAMTNWLFSVGHRAGADPTKAIQRALGLAPAPDTVWLVAGGPLPDNAIDSIREANASVNAHINTIGLYTQDGEEAMRRIADENRGVYRFIAPPNASPP